MDCRKFLLVALCIPLGCAGCVSTPDLKARTEVAFADFRVRDAGTRGEMAPAQKEAVYDRARIAYQHALQIDPDCKEAYAGLGNLYATLGNPSRAVEVYTKGLKKFPREPVLWFDLGMCQCRKKDWKAGLEGLQKAHDLDPDNRVYTRTLGLALARASRCAESEACLTQVMEPPDAQYTVARMLHHVGRDDLSRQYVQKALQGNPNLTGAQELYALLEGRGKGPAGPVVNLSFAAGGQPLPGEELKQ